MTTPVTTKDETVTLSSLARTIFAECKDVEVTTDRLMKKLRKDTALFRQQGAPSLARAMGYGKEYRGGKWHRRRLLMGFALPMAAVPMVGSL
jgi:hypothetical protein